VLRANSRWTVKLRKSAMLVFYTLVSLAGRRKETPQLFCRDVLFRCRILCGPGGERIVDIVPGGTELELQLRLGVTQAAHTCNNPHVNFTGVYCA
jgi:hypothetical protein